MSHNLRNGAAAARFFLHSLTAVILVGGAFWNLGTFGFFVSGYPAPELDEVVKTERRYVALHNALIREKYTSGKISFVTARSLKEQPSTELDEYHWRQLRFAAIPLLVVRNGFDAPYVIGDFTGGEEPAAPEGFITIENSEGFVLYKRMSQ